jgi:hypothetical protein
MTSYHKVVSDNNIGKYVSTEKNAKIRVYYRLNYYGLSAKERQKYIKLIGRFLKNALFLSAHGLGPYVLDVNIENVPQSHYSLSIIYEEIQVIDSKDSSTFPDEPNNLIVEITRVINKLHNQGYGHGDIIGNIGYRVSSEGYQILLLDPDSMFNITKARSGKDSYFIKWAEMGYDLYGMSDNEMVNELLTNDLTAWMSDELDQDQEAVEIFEMPSDEDTDS